MRLLKRPWSGLLKVFGPLLFLLFVMKLVNPREVVTIVREIRVDVVLASFALFPIMILAKTLRWWIICRQVGMRTSLGRLFEVYYVSWFLGAFPPSAVGALAKVFYLKEEGEPAARSLVSMTLDKFFDIMGLMIFGLYGFYYFPIDLLGGNGLFGVYCALVLVVCALLVFGKRLWNGFRTLLERYMRSRLAKAVKGLDEAMLAFWSELRPVSFLCVLGLSISIGLLRALVLYVLAVALGMHVTFGLMVGCRALVGITQVIPITINGLGTRDGVLLLTLPLWGISREAALALGFVAFLWILCFKFSGVVFWLRRPLPLKVFSSIKEKVLP